MFSGFRILAGQASLACQILSAGIFLLVAATPSMPKAENFDDVMDNGYELATINAEHAWLQKYSPSGDLELFHCKISIGDGSFKDVSHVSKLNSCKSVIVTQPKETSIADTGIESLYADGWGIVGTSDYELWLASSDGGRGLIFICATDYTTVGRCRATFAVEQEAIIIKN